MIPGWLHVLAIVSLGAGIVSAAAIATDLLDNPQRMAIMNMVWPVTALYGGALARAAYLMFGTRREGSNKDKPFSAAVAVGATHCGAGCTLGDIIAEWLCFAVPVVALWFGWHWLFAQKMFAIWVVDFLFASGFGIVFQYFAIAPTRGLSLGQGLVAAVKADTLSLAAWQVGMYGFMALAQYLYFRPLLGKPIEVDTPEFWLTMQIGMLCGFLTTVNWWLIKAGLKETM